MTFKITDEEYAVLDYIRSRKGTHIDHLNIVFKSSAEPAVKNLEKYALIAPDFPNKDIYHATMLGKAYRHEKPAVSKNKNEDDKQKNINQKHSHKKIGFNTVFTYVVGISTILGTIIALIALLKACS